MATDAIGHSKKSQTGICLCDITKTYSTDAKTHIQIRVENTDIELSNKVLHRILTRRRPWSVTNHSAIRAMHESSGVIPLRKGHTYIYTLGKQASAELLLEAQKYIFKLTWVTLKWEPIARASWSHPAIITVCSWKVQRTYKSHVEL